MKRSYGTLTGNTTVTVSLTANQDLALLLTQGGAGSYLVTWSGVTTWLTPSGSAPTLQTAVGAVDSFQFTCVGSTVYGTHSIETGAAGSTGSTGAAGITWRRTWSSATTYSINDAVYWNGSSYIALQASSSTNAQQPDQAPTYWGALAAGGGSGSVETVDPFTRADNADPSVGAPSGITYTKIAAATANLASNLLVDADHTDADCRYRASTVLTSVDHHCQVTLGAYVKPTPGSHECGGGPLVRYAAAADTAYLAIVNISSSTQWAVSIHKIVAGAFTTLGTGTATSTIPVAGDRIKLSVAGTTLTAYYNDVQQVQVTDSSITTGTQVGFHTFQQSATETISLSELRFGV